MFISYRDINAEMPLISAMAIHTLDVTFWGFVFPAPIEATISFSFSCSSALLSHLS